MLELDNIEKDYQYVLNTLYGECSGLNKYHTGPCNWETTEVWVGYLRIMSEKHHILQVSGRRKIHMC
jgi:hypothetical protein